jgi:hypothetical protein
LILVLFFCCCEMGFFRSYFWGVLWVNFGNFTVVVPCVVGISEDGDQSPNGDHGWVKPKQNPTPISQNKTQTSNQDTQQNQQRTFLLPTPSRPTQTTGVGLTERPAVFLVVGKTSALTLNVAGVVKDWLLIGFSWSVIKDTVTAVNLVGYLLAFMGVVYYNHSKFEGASGSGGAEEGAAHADRWGVRRATPWPRGGSPGTPDCVGMEEEGPEVADEPPWGGRATPWPRGGPPATLGGCCSFS